MPRKNYHAILLPNQVYHIYNHAVGKENLFKQPRNYAYFWQLWNKYITPYFANYAYCLMPNHFHVLCKAKEVSESILEKIQKEETIKSAAFIKGEIPVNAFYESQFQRLFGTYSKAINKQEENRYGSLFVAKFRRTVIPSKEDFLFYLFYIHHNPIHHNFVEDFSDWEHSSYKIYTEKVKEEGISTLPVFQCFSIEEGDILGNFLQGHIEFKRNYKYSPDMGN